MKSSITSERLSGLKKITLWTIICAGIISGTYIVLDEFLNRPLTGLSLTMGQGPVRILHTINSETGEFSEMRVAREGGEAFYVTAMDIAGADEYLMLAQAETPATNVYLRRADGSLTQVTNSDSLKYDLSVDTDSGTLAYVTSSATSTRALMQEDGGTITLFNQSTGEEQELGNGAGPVLLSQSELVYRSGGALMYHNTERGEAASLIVLPPYPKSGVGTVYAVNKEGREVAVYDNSARRIDIFTLENGQLIPERSWAVSDTPDALSYVDGKLTWTSVRTFGDNRSFIFKQENSLRTARALATGTSPLGNPITLYVTNN